MLTINKCISGGRGLAPVLVRRAATVALNWDVRQKSRFDALDSEGRRLAVFLPRGQVLRGGDMLVADDGSLVQVLAAPQPVLVVRHCPAHGSLFDLLRAAYHLGNRHVPLELKPDHLQLEPDHVLADMLRQQHLIVNEAEAAFEPEAGAYGNTARAPGHGHGHGPEGSHGHEHDPQPQHSHQRQHSHQHQPAQPHDTAPPHVHGPGCGHDHSHSHEQKTVQAQAQPAAHVHGPGCRHG